MIVVDSNDNVPEFSESRYEFSVAEDAAAETVIGVIKAQDPDSGSFGEISYSIKGFGSEKFSVRQLTGEVRIQLSCSARNSRFLESNWPFSPL